MLRRSISAASVRSSTQNNPKHLSSLDLDDRTPSAGASRVRSRPCNSANHQSCQHSNRLKSAPESSYRAFHRDIPEQPIELSGARTSRAPLSALLYVSHAASVLNAENRQQTTSRGSRIIHRQPFYRIQSAVTDRERIACPLLACPWGHAAIATICTESCIRWVVSQWHVIGHLPDATYRCTSDAAPKHCCRCSGAED